MSSITNGIRDIATRGILLVEDEGLREALAAAYRSPNGTKAAETADHMFRRLTSSQWPTDSICRFLAGWRSTHGTALFVSGLIIRVLRRAREANEVSRVVLNQVAAEIAEVISEDTGVDDTPHHERFAEFATCIVGDDRWKLSCFELRGCGEFRKFVKEQRLFAPIEEALLTTAASENWNAGEYTYFDNLVRPWMIEILGRSKEATEKSVGYVSVHAGETELGHFLHALNAWQLYCRAIGRKADATDARRVFERYFGAISAAFDELTEALAS